MSSTVARSAWGSRSRGARPSVRKAYQLPLAKSPVAARSSGILRRATRDCILPRRSVSQSIWRAKIEAGFIVSERREVRFGRRWLRGNAKASSPEKARGSGVRKRLVRPPFQFDYGTGFMTHTVDDDASAGGNGVQTGYHHSED